MRFTGTHILILALLGAVGYAIYSGKMGVAVSAGSQAPVTPSAPSPNGGTDPIQGVGNAVGGLISQLGSIFAGVNSFRQTTVKNT